MHLPMKLVSLSVITAVTMMGCGKEAPPPAAAPLHPLRPLRLP